MGEVGVAQDGHLSRVLGGPQLLEVDHGLHEAHPFLCQRTTDCLSNFSILAHRRIKGTSIHGVPTLGTDAVM